MKNMTKIFGIIAFAAVITLALTGCNTLQTVEISGEPAKIVYGQGQGFDTKGLAAVLTYKKGNTENVSGLNVSGYNMNKPGEQTVTVSYQQKKVGNSATFTVTVVPVEKIAIEQPPAQLVYKEGDDASWNGLSIGVTFEKDAVPGVMLKPGANMLTISEYIKDKAGTQTITVDYYGKRAAFEVKVIGLDSIAVTSPPQKIEYYTGEEIEMPGLVVKGTWSDGSSAEVKITKNDLSGYDITRGGKQNVTVSYSRKTTTFPVTYIAFEALSVDRPPTKVKYELGEALEITGIRILGTWPGHSMSIVNNSRLKITGYDPLRAGEQKITVTVGGQSDSFTVTVTNPFEGTWAGQWKTGSQLVDGKSIDVFAPVVLTMEGSAWSLRTNNSAGETVELRGVYTPDSNTHAKLQCNDTKGAGDVNRDSSTVMRLRNGLIGSEVTLKK
ncbi:MAG: bacterial Ig-like domain-containing protein [Treponema sp.]|jgi:uncharacterized protein YkuJ|nr:bacterial Ig-like domain-containing protein [Treponema sp.]